jgi:hypothetical protein
MMREFTLADLPEKMNTRAVLHLMASMCLCENGGDIYEDLTCFLTLMGIPPDDGVSDLDSLRQFIEDNLPSSPDHLSVYTIGKEDLYG